MLTGVTGFIGEQLLWKILTELPETRPAVLVRRKGSAGARDRMLTLLRKPLFGALREAAGGAEALLEQRIEVIEGDLPNVPPLPADLDIAGALRGRRAPSTRPSTRPSRPTWSAPGRCWIG